MSYGFFFYLSHFDTIPITKVESWEKPGDALVVLSSQCTKCSSTNFECGLDSKCPSQVVVQDFSVTAFDFSGSYTELKPTTNGTRGFYRHDTRDQFCMWWHKPYQHWWIGSCSNRGDNSGFAWLEPNVQCPTEGKNGEWRQSHTDEVIDGTVTEADHDKIEIAIEG